MATTTTNYGTRTQLAQYTNINSLASNEAKPLGKIDNSSTKATDLEIDIQVTLNSTGVSATGTLELYLLASPDDTSNSYTDGLDPAGTANIAASIKNAVLVRVMVANANNQVVRERFVLPRAFAPKYGALVLYNKSGAALNSSGNDAGFTPVKFDTA